MRRDPAYNVAYWNVAERPDPSGWRLFHCSGFDPERMNEVCRYWPGRRIAEVGPAGSLWENYGGWILAAGYGETRSWAGRRSTLGIRSELECASGWPKELALAKRRGFGSDAGRGRRDWRSFGKRTGC